jgi:hypothetical protein
MTLMCASKLPGLRSHDIYTTLFNTGVMRRYNHINNRRGGDVTHDVPVSFAARVMTVLTVECCYQQPDSHFRCSYFGSGLRLTWDQLSSALYGTLYRNLAYPVSSQMSQNNNNRNYCWCTGQVSSGMGASVRRGNATLALVDDQQCLLWTFLPRLSIVNSYIQPFFFFRRCRIFSKTSSIPSNNYSQLLWSGCNRIGEDSFRCYRNSTCCRLFRFIVHKYGELREER